MAAAQDPHPLLPLLKNARPQRLLLGLGALLCLGGFIYLVRDVATPVFAALGISYVLAPLVDVLEKRKIPRPVSVMALMLLTTLVAGGVIALVVPTLVEQLSALAVKIPGWTASLVLWAEQRLGVQVPHNAGELMAGAREALGQLGAGTLSRVGSSVWRFVAGGAGAITGVLGLALVPLFVFFFLQDWHAMSTRSMNLLPAPMQGPIRAKLAQIDGTLSAYLRGVLTVASILAVLYSLALSALGVPLGLLIGVLAGMAYVVPFLSPIVGVGLGLLFCFLEFRGFGPIIGVVLTFVIGNVIESFVLTPRIVGDSLGLPPVAVILAVMIGGSLFGFLGVMLALPSAAVLQLVGADLLALWKSSELYRTGLSGGA